MPKKPRKRTTPKQRDPSWRTRHALGHKVEPNPKAYTRKLKHPEEIEDPEGDWYADFSPFLSPIIVSLGV